MSPSLDDVSARRALAAFDGVSGLAHIHRLSTGLINQTFAIDTDDQRFVLQQVNGLFSPEVHINIAAATNHLRARGFPAPRLMYGRDGFPWVELADGVWRLMTRLPGRTVEVIETVEQVVSGADAFARFHSALSDVEFDFVAFHTDIHATDDHLREMHKAYEAHHEHRLFTRVAPLIEEIASRVDTLPRCDGLRRRIVHGDPKIANVLFDDRGAVAGIIDLDTVGPLPLHLELGDMWRSWCNPHGESAPVAQFKMSIFEMSLAAYARALTLEISPEEIEAIVHGVEWITLEQAARFATDALNETYFGWNSDVFATAGDHNLSRAKNQLQLHVDVVAHRRARATLVRLHFS